MTSAWPLSTVGDQFDVQLGKMRDTLLARVGPDGVASLFSSGPTSSAWFEHRLLAERSGLLLVQADEHLVPVVAACASIDSLHRMLRQQDNDIGR